MFDTLFEGFFSVKKLFKAVSTLAFSNLLKLLEYFNLENKFYGKKIKNLGGKIII